MQDRSRNEDFSGQLSQILQDSWRSPVRPRQETWKRDEGAGSGYSRDRQARWDLKEMRTATTKVRREVYQEFDHMCRERGKTPYNVLQGLLIAWMTREKERRAREESYKTW